MQSNATTPDDFLAGLDSDWRRRTLEQIRAIIQREAPDLEESMHHKMLGYSDDDEFIFHLNVQRGYVSLYVDDISEIDPDGALLDGLDLGKGCIRFKASTSVPETRIDAFIARAIESWKRSDDPH